MKKKTIKNSIRLIILIIIILLLILLCMWSVKNIIKNKYKKILLNNDFFNYEIIQIVDGIEDQISKVRNSVLIVDDGENLIWLNKNENKSIIINKNKKTAIITAENNVKIASLNETYIREYFENKDNKFRYIGKENNYALLEFTNKNTGIVIILYLNLNTNLIEKQVMKTDIAESVIEYKIKLNSVSKDEIKEPDLTEYYVVNK